MSEWKTFVIVFVSLILFRELTAQYRYSLDPDPCMWDEARAQEALQKLGPGWGYNYDSLLTDLERWGGSPFVGVDSAGASVQGRALWTLEITDTAAAEFPRTRISIHARTHPGEVQSSWVTNQIIDFLISDSLMALELRSKCIFNIMPMYNPDGVELGYGRENANGIDLERNWDKSPHEPETATLKRMFEEYMASESPIRVALNMHSSSDGERFFVYHHENGTSLDFIADEKRYIGGIHTYWPEGIQDWYYYISWQGGAPTHFPESWFWFNFQESVMALTYEDIYGNENQTEFKRAAEAILLGTHDFLFEDPQPVDDPVEMSQPDRFTVLSVYPNPFNNATRFRMYLPEAGSVDMDIFDALGRRVHSSEHSGFARGYNSVTWSAGQLSSGIYYVLFQAEGVVQSKRIILIK